MAYAASHCNGWQVIGAQIDAFSFVMDATIQYEQYFFIINIEHDP